MDELNKIAGKKLPYKVSDGYFEKQREQLLKIAEGKQTTTTIGRTRKWISAAAIVAVLFTGAGVWFWSANKEDIAKNNNTTTNIYSVDEGVSEEALLELAEADIFLNEI